MKILITGVAGFVGYHAVWRCLREGHQVVGVDCSDYFFSELQFQRLHELGIEGGSFQSKALKGFTYRNVDLTDENGIHNVFKSESFDFVIHFAALTGVRESVKNPRKYFESNIVGFFNILECCRTYNVQKLIYASSSSVYGNSSESLLSTNLKTDTPLSFYASTKKSNELMAHSYAQLYRIQTLGLRFFTLYGPWGRDNMFPYITVDALLNGKTIDLYNHGDMTRDFTYIDDAVEVVVKFLVQMSSTVNVPSEQLSRVFNVGTSFQTGLLEFVQIAEKITEKKLSIRMQPIQKGDVVNTRSYSENLNDEIDFAPRTQLDKGLSLFINWYKDYV